MLAIGPFAAEQARSAVAAKGFNSAVTLAVDLDHLQALYEVELLSPHPRLCANGCAGMFTAPITVTMIGLDKGGFDFKSDFAAQTTATNPFVHEER